MNTNRICIFSLLTASHCIKYMIHRDRPHIFFAIPIFKDPFIILNSGREFRFTDRYISMSKGPQKHRYVWAEQTDGPTIQFIIIANILRSNNSYLHPLIDQLFANLIGITLNTRDFLG